MNLPKTPTWVPQRLSMEHNQQGNPLGPGPNLQHPAWNPGGLLPGPNVTSGPYAWSKVDSHSFRSDGTNQVWMWETPVFDLRPGMSAAYGQIPMAVPINHEAALGQSVYLAAIVGDSSGASPPALRTGFSAEYMEFGNAVVSDSGQLMALTQSIPITDIVLAGGTSGVAPFGASPMSFQPCIVGLRFWKLRITFTIAGVGLIAQPYFCMAVLH